MKKTKKHHFVEKMLYKMISNLLKEKIEKQKNEKLQFMYINIHNFIHNLIIHADTELYIYMYMHTNIALHVAAICYRRDGHDLRPR